ncbi:DNA polymerase IV [Schaalia sp. lx-260]|uniref:DNA polymerase IV n=1 Tax=Schaalia sp. lx-260 TaxID=2899082 RepID=UPI001E5365EF|nr:DNA polymerase IV [Schaalia sp. lx-260]MCD4549233.1 DNA polymerase IV [Schaalia sp. lx-260]
MSHAPRDSRGVKDWGDDDSHTPILHVDMDSFFAEVELQENPQLRGRPLIVGGKGNRGVVTSATYEARALGVRAGMPMGRARSLCPHAYVVASRYSLYSQYSHRVMEVLSSITPVYEQVSIDEAFLDVSGARRRLGSPRVIGELIRQRVRTEVGLPASVGIAVNKSVAKIASANAKPDGLLLISHEATLPFLHGLPVGALWGVGARTVEILEREGVTTIGDLAALPIDRVVKLLGTAHAHHVHNLAWGIDPRPVAAVHPEKSVGVERTFEHNIYSREELERFVLAASHKCAARLRRAGLVASGVALKIRDGNFVTVTRSATLPDVTDVGRSLALAAQRLLKAQPIPLAGVRLLGVRAEGLRRADEGFAVPLEEDPRPRATERAMDQVVERFGAYALRPARLLESTKNGDSSPRATEH